MDSQVPVIVYTVTFVAVVIPDMARVTVTEPVALFDARITSLLSAMCICADTDTLPDTAGVTASAPLAQVLEMREWTCVTPNH
jgi:hypothetical protein